MGSYFWNGNFICCICIYDIYNNKTIATGVDVPGYASLMVVILFLGGIQLVFLGVIGEYLGRTFNESKHRPLYFIERYNEEKETNEHLNK